MTFLAKLFVLLLCHGTLIAMNSVMAFEPFTLHVLASEGQLEELKATIANNSQPPYNNPQVHSWLNSCFHKSEASCPAGLEASLCNSDYGNSPFASCITVLHAAAMWRQPQVIAYLVIDLGVGIDDMPARWTALHHAFNSHGSSGW